VRAALDDVLRTGPLTYDLARMGEAVASTDDFSTAVVARFCERVAADHR
jgi:hypothetical protein